MGLAVLRNLMTKKNPGAYRGKLTCPVCRSEAVRYVEEVCLGRSRYRCRKCGLPFQYDWSNSPAGTHPYAAWKNSKFQRIVEMNQRGVAPMGSMNNLRKIRLGRTQKGV